MDEIKAFLQDNYNSGDPLVLTDRVNTLCDSLDWSELQWEAESRFLIDIPDDAWSIMYGTATVGGLIDYLDTKRGGR